MSFTDLPGARRIRYGIAAVLFVIMASSPHPASSQNTEQDMERASALAARWSRIVNQRFEKARARTSENSGELLERLIVGGATRAVRDHAGDTQLSSADAGIERFAEAMIQAGTRQEDGTIRLGEGSFAAARNKVCPLYPFC